MDQDTRAIVDGLKEIKKAVESSYSGTASLDDVVEQLKEMNEKLGRIEGDVERLKIEITEKD